MGFRMLPKSVPYMTLNWVVIAVILRYSTKLGSFGELISGG